LDRGDDLPMTVLRLVRAFAETSAMREAIFIRMEGQPLSGKGAQRRMLAVYLALVDRELRLAQAIGLDRKSKSIMTIDQILAEHEP
jgi:hypothetical protein